MVRVAEQGNWQELSAACENDGERKALAAIRDAGLPPPTTAQHTIFADGVPVAKPDFYYAEQRCAVFVDGSIHDLDFKHADDESKRRKLKRLGYGVIALRTDEVATGLQHLAEQLGVSLT